MDQTMNRRIAILTLVTMTLLCGELHAQVGPPVTILAGALSETHTVDFVRHLASQIPDCEYEIIPGTGHFLPMEMPEIVVDHVRRIGSRLTG